MLMIEMLPQTAYECRNVTKVHCTTLWTVDETGQKVLAFSFLKAFLKYLTRELPISRIFF